MSNGWWTVTVLWKVDVTRPLWFFCESAGFRKAPRQKTVDFSSVEEITATSVQAPACRRLQRRAAAVPRLDRAEEGSVVSCCSRPVHSVGASRGPEPQRQRRHHVRLVAPGPPAAERRRYPPTGKPVQTHKHRTALPPSKKNVSKEAFLVLSGGPAPVLEKLVPAGNGSRVSVSWSWQPGRKRQQPAVGTKLLRHYVIQWTGEPAAELQWKTVEKNRSSTVITGVEPR